jgi:cytoplasmic iron level regulating protein YaaA (DUF328/UPF0246 family)
VSDVLVLLPPSEGKAGGGAGPVWHATATGEGPLGPARRRAVDALTAALDDPAIEPAAVLRYASNEVLARAVAVDRAVDRAGTRPAIERYTGVVLDGLDRETLTAGERRCLDGITWFVSGLWGLVAATDPVPDYRVKIGAALPGLGVLGTWWRPQVTPVIEELAAGRWVWNLLTAEHGRVWTPGGSAVAVATVGFTAADGGRRGVSNYHGKQLKGRFLRHLVTTDPSSIDAAARFRSDGFRLDAAASRLTGERPELVFTAAEA